MLINDFYHCQDLETTDSQISCRLVFNSAHDIFKGHFPGNPVVPGVCTMEIIKELLQQQVSKPLTLRSTGNVKFLGLVTPDTEPAAKITWKATDSGYSVSASLTRGDSTIFKFDGSYVPSL